MPSRTDSLATTTRRTNRRPAVLPTALGWGLNPLDAERAESMADEGGASGATVERENAPLGFSPVVDRITLTSMPAPELTVSTGSTRAPDWLPYAAFGAIAVGCIALGSALWFSKR